MQSRVIRMTHHSRGAPFDRLSRLLRHPAFAVGTGSHASSARGAASEHRSRQPLVHRTRFANVRCRASFAYP